MFNLKPLVKLLQLSSTPNSWHKDQKRLSSHIKEFNKLQTGINSILNYQFSWISSPFSLEENGLINSVDNGNLAPSDQLTDSSRMVQRILKSITTNPEVSQNLVTKIDESTDINQKIVHAEFMRNDQLMKIVEQIDRASELDTKAGTKKYQTDPSMNKESKPSVEQKQTLDAILRRAAKNWKYKSSPTRSMNFKFRNFVAAGDSVRPKVPPNLFHNNNFKSLLAAKLLKFLDDDMIQQGVTKSKHKKDITWKRFVNALEQQFSTAIGSKLEFIEQRIIQNKKSSLVFKTLQTSLNAADENDRSDQNGTVFELLNNVLKILPSGGEQSLPLDKKSNSEIKKLPHSESSANKQPTLATAQPKSTIQNTFNINLQQLSKERDNLHDLADKIAEILADQARRHGIDLT